MSVQPGGIKIENLQLLGSNGFKFIDLTEIVVEFNTYESLDQPFMKCEILLTDALALITQIPIVGNELIKIKFFVPVEGMESDPFERVFRVMKIEKLSVDKMVRTASYILTCYDTEYFFNHSTTFSEGFDDQAHKIVEKIWTKYLRGDSAKLKTTDCNKIPIVIPYTSPYNAIKLVSQLAESAETPDISSHVFFASKAGATFTSIGALCDKTKKPSDYNIDRYTLKEKNVSQTTAEKKVQDKQGAPKKPNEWLKMNSFEIVNRMDIDAMAKDYSIGSTTWYINPNVKLYGKTDYMYTRDFEKFPKIAENNGYPVINNEKKEFEFTAGNFFIVTQEGQNMNTDAYDKRHKFLSFGTAAKRLLNSVMVNVTIPGDNTRIVGDLINLHFPEFGATDDILGETDKYISGNYVITAVRHLYNIETGFVTVLRCNKNAFEYSISDTIAKNADGQKASLNSPTTNENTATPPTEVRSADI